MSGLRHLVFTRFNLRPWMGDGPDQHLDEQWLRARLEIFKRTAAPCVAAQSVQDFDWFLFIDPATPEWVQDGLRAAAARGRLVPIRTEELGRAARHHGREAAEDGAMLVTTRIDSDDCIERTFLERVRTICLDTPGYVCFRNGYQLDMDSGVLTEAVWDSNSLMSLAEPNGPDIVTVHSGSHNRVSPVTNVAGERMWVHGIHGRNVYGKRRRGRPVHPRALRDRFALDPSLLEAVGPVAFAARRLKWSSTRAVRSVARRVRSG